MERETEGVVEATRVDAELPLTGGTARSGPAFVGHATAPCFISDREVHKLSELIGITACRATDVEGKPLLAPELTDLRPAALAALSYALRAVVVVREPRS